LTASRDFEGLEAFSKSKRSPIGYEAFVHHLVQKGHPKEALTYIARCDGPKRADLYVECGEWRMAGKECKERGDKAKLEYVDSVRLTLSLLNYLQAVTEVGSQLSDRTGARSASVIYEVRLRVPDWSRHCPGNL
jgi:hypothetical protein